MSNAASDDNSSLDARGKPRVCFCGHPLHLHNDGCCRVINELSAKQKEFLFPDDDALSRRLVVCHCLGFKDA